VNEWVVVVLAICSAFAFAVSTSLKHASAGRVPDAQGMRAGQLGRFVGGTLSHPLWLAGIACDVVGLLLQVFALHLGALAVVQPLLITGLLFALAIRRVVGHHRLTRFQLGWAGLLTVALAGFVLLASVGAATASDSGADRLPAVVGGCVGLGMAVASVVLGRLARRRGQSAALLGVAVGIVYAATAALLKTVTNIATQRHLALLATWQLYVLLALGAVGLLLTQLAFQAGPLAASLPAAATVDPLLSVVIGVAVFDEHIRRGPGAGVALVIILLVIGIAVIQLARRSEDRLEGPDSVQVTGGEEADDGRQPEGEQPVDQHHLDRVGRGHARGD
jgi:drug/metabolite transporter (DMT)-like permease